MLKFHNVAYFILAHILLFIMNVSAYAEAPKWLQLRVKVVDQITKRPILYPQFALYDTVDSTSIPTTWVGMSDVTMLRVPWGNATYQLVVMAPTISVAGNNETIQKEIEKQGSYESERVEVKISGLKENDVIYDGPTISLSRVKPKKLNEVTVTASKVMFYNKGDTLVYNADAFVFSEGSSLDAIIEQMPGVELRSNGRIYVNGKFVDALLLNGKDLFNGNNQLMLENLPAYTVKDIAVYNNAGRSSRLMGYNTGDTKYVMDVRLKRQYRTGGLLRIEGGYGTSDRYLGRLFGMLFSDNVSFSAYAGANNLSDAGRPGQSDGSWSVDRMGNGLSKRQMGGLSYIAQGYDNKWEAKGNVDVLNTNVISEQYTTTQTYLQQRDNFYYGWDKGQNKKLSVKTSLYFAFDVGSRVTVECSPGFEYANTNDYRNSLSATFNNNYNESITQEIVETIYKGDSEYRQSLIYRNQQQRKYLENYIYGKLAASIAIKTKSTGLKNMLTLDVDGDYTNARGTRFTRFMVDYAENPTSSANQYFKLHPSYNWNYSASLKFRTMLSEVVYGDFFKIEYKYRGSNKTGTSNLYLLNILEDSEVDKLPFGYLPPESTYESAIDKGQSYSTHTKENFHSLYLQLYRWAGAYGGWNFNINYSCNLELADRAMDYLSNNNISVHRTNFLPTYSLGTSMYKHFFYDGSTNKKKEMHWDLNISGKPLRVSLLDAVDYVNTTNPLYIIMGNPDIKDAYKLDAELKFSHSNYKRSQTQHANISYTSYVNALSKGIYYDTSSGRQFERAYNVGGNWDVKAYYSFSTVLGPYRRFEFTTQTTPKYSHTYDLFEPFSETYPDFASTPHKRSINSLSIYEFMKFSWKVGAHRLTAKGGVEFRNYRSEDRAFNNFSAWNSDVGISAILNFPHNWEVSTDVALFMRRGYMDSALNTSDVIWNLRVSKSLFNGKILIAADGFDLLHQLSNITYRINAQARTEVVSNTIPNYFLLHICWNFNKSPKTK